MVRYDSIRTSGSCGISGWRGITSAGTTWYRMKLLFPLPPHRAQEQLAAAAAAAVVSHPEDIDREGARGLESETR